MKRLLLILFALPAFGAEMALDDLSNVDPATGRTALGVVIGTDIQPYDADLAAFAGLAGVQGDVLFHNGTSWNRLPAGTSGFFLRTNGAGANPTWAAGGSFDESGSFTLTGTWDFTSASVALGAFSATTVNAGSLVFEGATADDFETTLGVVDPTADRSINLPDASGTVLLDGSEEGKTESETITILEPDIVQAVSDIILLKHFPAEKYPNGVTMVSVHIGAASAYTNEDFNIEESASPTGSTPSTVEAINLTASATGEDDGTFTDGDIAADGYLFVDLDAAPEDVAFVAITITYTID